MTTAIKTSRGRRQLTFVKVSTVRSTIPSWAWEHGERGRMLKGGLTLFAGRPAAGKSTAARWFAAGFTNGTLPGCWEGKPVNVFYHATEEHVGHVVVPSLKAAGADLERVCFMQDGDKQGPARVKSKRDEIELLELCIEHDIRVIVLDPLLSTIGSEDDIYRSNQVRDALDPWVRIAEKIDGVVIGLVHLVKEARSVVGGINGSSAFGEVARCVFGMAADHTADDGTRVMSQAKNSSGVADLNLAYTLGERSVTVTSGETTEMAYFDLIGLTRRTVDDILREANAPVIPKPASAEPESAQPRRNACEAWLEGRLSGKDAESAAVVQAAAEAAGFSKDQVKRASQKLGVSKSRDGFGGGWIWSLPPQGAPTDSTEL